MGNKRTVTRKSWRRTGKWRKTTRRRTGDEKRRTVRRRTGQRRTVRRHMVMLRTAERRMVKPRTVRPRMVMRRMERPGRAMRTGHAYCGLQRRRERPIGTILLQTVRRRRQTRSTWRRRAGRKIPVKTQ